MDGSLPQVSAIRYVWWRWWQSHWIYFGDELTKDHPKRSLLFKCPLSLRKSNEDGGLRSVSNTGNFGEQMIIFVFVNYDKTDLFCLFKVSVVLPKWAKELKARVRREGSRGYSNTHGDHKVRIESILNSKRFVLIFWYFESNMFTVFAKNLPIAGMTWLDLSGCIFLR